MLDIDLDVDPIVHAIKDGRLDIELKSRGPTVEVVSLRLRLVSPRLEKNSKSHSRMMFTIPCSRKYSLDTHHPSYVVTRSTKQSSDIDRLVLDHRDGVRRC